MTEYIAQCRYNRSDTIKARVGDEVVWLEPGDDNVALSPAAARTFARGILTLADEVDGGEAPVKTDTRPKVGDKVRVLEDSANGATVKRGDILTVLDVNDHEVETEGQGYGGRWYLDHDKVEVAAPLADWERDMLKEDDTLPKPTRSRAALLDAATDLMHYSSTYTAHDLITLAEYLAEEK
ncbi:hypothetical protein [Streptomyces sp. IBSNAI001]|uniref:hypothetical protein n=1 Tax=Streptomyces sp. IBSNAI001 TaxID=3457499 RepID=UPI003FD06736